MNDLERYFTTKFGKIRRESIKFSPRRKKIRKKADNVNLEEWRLS
jgi:hypothetical protein